MLIRNQKMFNLGLAMGVSFVVVLLLIFSPLFGKNGEGKERNGLEFSDDLFNNLSKGSSYFIPKVKEKAAKFTGKTLSITVKLDAKMPFEKVQKIFTVAGAMVGGDQSQFKLEGDMGKILTNLCDDSDAMFKNDGSVVKSKYNMEGKDVLKLYHGVLSAVAKELQKTKKIEEANIILDVLKKAVEPAYNYYGIAAVKVLDRAFLMTSLLIFYVVYTMWWGYAIFYMFDGIGLSMKKSKVKKEV